MSFSFPENLLLLWSLHEWQSTFFTPYSFSFSLNTDILLLILQSLVETIAQISRLPLGPCHGSANDGAKTRRGGRNLAKCKRRTNTGLVKENKCKWIFHFKIIQVSIKIFASCPIVLQTLLERHIGRVISEYSKSSCFYQFGCYLTWP